MSERYRWRGGDELWVRSGAGHKHQIIIFEPLFEEKNRTRRLMADVMRGLDHVDIGCTLPDLPGTGESVRDIATVSMADWRSAADAVIASINPAVTASFRGGALLTGAGNVWRFAPESGERIVRDLKRTALASVSATTLYAGHALAETFLAELEGAQLPQPVRLRTIRLDSDAGDADAKMIGTPLWRRAEPGEDSALAVAIIADLTEWVKLCVAC